MNQQNKRLNLIGELQEKLDSSIICYITGDRENLNTRIAPDVIRVFHRHLESIGPKKKITLFLYTRGGDVLTPWRLVNLIREYCLHFSILVPFRAYSAGTLICLGADEIIMGKMGGLSPIDPSVANAFNPEDPNNKIAKIPVSVEDVSSYIGLAQELAGLSKEEEIKEIFLQLSKEVHPLALGNVHRNYSLIRSLGRKLLELHSKEESGEQIKQMIDNLTEQLYAHNYMIPRSEAKNNIKLKVSEPSEDIEKLMWNLYEHYEQDLQLIDPFNPSLLLKDHEQQVDFEATGGMIESLKNLDMFIFEGRVTRQARQKQEVSPVNTEVLRQKWKSVK